MKSRASWLNSSYSLRSLLVAPPALLLAAALLALAPHAAFASGADDGCDDDECSSFFAPEVIQNQAETPFFRSYRTFYQHAYDIEADAVHNLSAVNTEEWFHHFDGKIKAGTLSWMLYKMELADLDNLILVMDGKSAPLSDRAKVLQKVLTSYGQKSKVMAALRYVDFAKKVEPMATRRSGENSWDPNEQTKHAGEDAATARTLLALAPALIHGSDSFIAQRLKMQVIRLMFYTNQTSEAESYFEANIATFGPEDSAKWRFMETAAGALYKDKQYGKANYLFSLVYGHMPSLKKSAYFSFHPMEQSDWNQTLAMAKSNHEREVLWQLLGVYADGMAAIDQIYAINPKSDLLPLLLVREVNKAEEDWSMNYNMAANNTDDNPTHAKSDRDAVGVQRLARLKAITDAGHVGKLYLWRLSVGHLMALAGDTRSAEHYIRASAEGMPNDSVVRGQARASLLLAKIRSMSSVDHASEDMLAKEMTWLGKYKSDVNFRAINLNTWLLARLSALYAKNGDVTRSLMLTDAPHNGAYRDPKKTEAIIAFQHSAHSAFDQFLVHNYQYNLAQLRELQAIAALYKGDFASSLAYLKMAGQKAQNHAIYADPFTARIVDCHDCEIGEKPVLTLQAFVTRMQDLAATAAGSGSDAANANLLLGNASYNMSYFGNGRSIYDTDYGNMYPERYDHVSDSDLALNQDMAERYYNRAAALATDKEVKAQATFLAAKAEQNRWFNTHPDDDNSAGHAGKYFEQLKNGYADTKYYAEVVQECGYFKKYLGR